MGSARTTASEPLPQEAVTRTVRLGDMDGDRDFDLVVGVERKSFVQLNDGTGVFGPGNLLPIGAEALGEQTVTAGQA